MANTKKYVSLDKLGLYDEKIKKFMADADAAALKSAQDYADGLATNYDAAGSAASALAEAKTYADGKDAAIQAAQAAAEAAAAAAGVADGKAVAAQGEVDALETYVGTFTHDTAKSVVEYINAKTDGIATSGNLEALGSRVTAVEGDVATIKGDYLKGTDKTELEGKINGVQTAVDTEKGRAEGIEAGLRTDINTVMGDYLKGSDKTELQGNIDAVAGNVATVMGDYLKGSDKTELEGKINGKVDQTAYDTKMGEIDETTESLQTQINTIMNNPDAEGAINSINEFTKYVADHGTIADGFRTDIDKNKTDIAAEVKRAGEAETALSGRLDVLEAIDHEAYVAADEVLAGRIDVLEKIDHEAYVAADTALKNELNGEIAKKADTSAVNTAVKALEDADGVLAGRLDALEGKFTGEGSVEDMISDAKQEAIDSAVGTASADATAKANAAEAAAKGHADSLNTAMSARVDALEAIDHDHSNKAELDLIVSGDKAKWDEAYAKRHEHGNKTVLDGITAENITTWNTVTSKAAQSDLTAVGDRVTAIETWHSNFVEVSEEEINGMFA
jgi:hypothetical protein